MRTVIVLVAAAIVLVPPDARAQTNSTQSPAAPASPELSLAASVFTYAVPDDDNFIQPTIAVDRNPFHFEVRLNYEDLDTASVWAGRTFEIGERVALEITPMAGVVLGNTNGGALGYTGSITWGTVDLSSETEYVFAAGDAESFLYTWSELGWSPVEWLRGGFAVQRTKTYRTGFDIQRGFFGALYFGKWELSTYVFNPDADPTVVLGVAITF